MTRLTLEWHLKAILHGATEPSTEVTATKTIKTPTDDPPIEIPVEQTHDPGSYATGFPTDGRFCTAFDIPVREALNADDTVVFLDQIAHDPTRRFQQRHDAAELLNHHIWPDSPSDTNSIQNAQRDDIDIGEWNDSGMIRRDIAPTYFPMECSNPSCSESECLADPDTLRDRGIAECMVCGEIQPTP